jgi:hypothetical protein
MRQSLEDVYLQLLGNDGKQSNAEVQQ